MFVRTAKQPELPIVLLEDVGAEIGLAFALFGLLMTHFTGNARWDAVGSVAIGILLAVIGGRQAVRRVSGLSTLKQTTGRVQVQPEALLDRRRSISPA